jgi:hypothetical protein
MTPPIRVVKKLGPMRARVKLLCPIPAVLIYECGQHCCHEVEAVATYRNGYTKWLPCFAATAMAENQHWVGCLVNVANATSCEYVLDKLGGVSEVELNGSRIPSWIQKIRELVQQLAMGELENPIIVDRTTKRGKWSRQSGKIYKGCRLTLDTFNVLTNKFRLQLESIIQSFPQMIPFVNHHYVKEQILLFFQLAALHSSKPGLNSDKEFLFAAIVETTAPFLFPSVPPNSRMLADMICERSIVNYEGKFDLGRLARNFGIKR